mgnify:CR=1 FL=1
MGSVPRSRQLDLLDEMGTQMVAASVCGYLNQSELLLKHITAELGRQPSAPPWGLEFG